MHLIVPEKRGLCNRPPPQPSPARGGGRSGPQCAPAGAVSSSPRKAGELKGECNTSLKPYILVSDPGTQSGLCQRSAYDEERYAQAH
jgi:hypothetical protein